MENGAMGVVVLCVAFVIEILHVEFQNILLLVRIKQLVSHVDVDEGVFRI